MRFAGRKGMVLGMMLCMMLLFTACGEYEESAGEKNTIVIHADNSIDATIVRIFDQSYYSEEELVSMVNEELTTYNTEHGSDAISVKAHGLSGQEISLTLHFKSWEDYNRYMLDRIYVGDVQGAYDERYDFNQALSYASDKEHTIGKNDLMQMADQKIVVIDGHHSVEVPDKIRFYTQGMKLTGAKTAESVEEGLWFVIY